MKNPLNGKIKYIHYQSIVLHTKVVKIKINTIV